MKKINVIKTIQLTLLVLFTAVCAYLIFFKEELYHAIAIDPAVKMIAGLLWAALIMSYLFLLGDFVFVSKNKRDFRQLRDSISSDPLSGLANRTGCDAIIQKYEGKDLPENLGCIMFDIGNICQINKDFGHAEGDRIIRDFSNILRMSAVGLCFVGRNGGNKFLAIFEDCQKDQKDQIDQFLMRIDRKIQIYNTTPSLHAIEYSYGVAFREGPEIQSIPQLIALADKRLSRRR